MSGAMTEFKITSDLAALRSQVIEANFEEVKSWLDENLEPYRNMVVSESMISTAKTYRANIRKVKDRIEQSRKEAKNAALAAYTEFETKCKALTGLCDDAAGSLDGQIKAFEDAEKEAKIADIKAVYDAIDKELRGYLAWEKIYNPKWENKGYAADAAKTEITSAFDAVAQDIDTIRSLGTENAAYLLDFYRRTNDLSATIRKNAELIALKEAEEKRIAEIKAKKAQVAETVAEKPVEKPAEKQPKQTLYSISFNVVGTADQLNSLKRFMKESGIEYRPVIS